MNRRSTGMMALVLVALFALTALSPRPIDAAAPPSPPTARGILAPQDDVDAFMEKVLERREINWDQVYNYVFGEIEKLRIRGVEIAALQSFDQEYTWYVREGYLVRSPWKVNGVEVDAATRQRDELEWLEKVKNDDEETRIERDAFFNFEFEPGNYFFAGREVFEGREVVRIEYYPTHAFFEDEEDRQVRDQQGEERRRGGGEDDEFDEEEIEHMFAKTSLVTMLVLPEEHQIVKWTFENVGFEFLPYRWLVRMDELRAEMIMDQPIEGVWLPREIRAAAAGSTASFNLAVEYSREFADYKETAVGAGVIFGRPIR